MSSKYDFLDDVAVVELVNQISIAKEKTATIKKYNTFVGRMYNLFTGATNEHQNDLNSELSGAVESIKAELLNSNKSIFKNSLALKRIAEVLLVHKQSLKLVESDIEQLKSKISELEIRLRDVEGHNAADRVVESWSRQCNRDNNLLYELIHLVQMLYWSDFTEPALQNSQLRQYGYDKCWNAIHEKFNLKEDDLIRQVYLAEQFESLPKLEQDALELMLPYISSTLISGYDQNKMDSLLKEATLSRVVPVNVLLSDLYENSFKVEEVL
ncbi:hypothetical protein ACSIJM_02340 [Vibrio parahaemolyticus]